MSEQHGSEQEREQEIVVVTGPAGSGRSTAIGALEDLGFEAIDNLPISLLPRLFSGPPLTRPVVVGIDPRNRDFSVAGVLETIEAVARETSTKPVLAFLDCDAQTLLRRYKYPPDRQEEATETVLRQAEALSAEWVAE